jgi:hypothetical protein
MEEPMPRKAIGSPANVGLNAATVATHSTIENSFLRIVSLPDICL